MSKVLSFATAAHKTFNYTSHQLRQYSTEGNRLCRRLLGGSRIVSMAVLSTIPVAEASNFTVGNDLDHAVQKVSLAVRTCNGSQTEGVGPRFVEPIINASIAITASLLDLNPQELTLESNVPVVGKLAYGTLDFMINGKQGGVPIKVSEAEQAFTSADEAQLLVQMATVRDISETADQDIFGILTSGRTWAFYKYEPGSAAPTYATLSMPEGEGLEPQVKVVIEAIVGIMRQLSGAG